MVNRVKVKSKRAATKRFKILPTSKKIKRWHAYTSHLAYSKSTKQKRHLRKSSLLNKSDWKRLKKII